MRRSGSTDSLIGRTIAGKFEIDALLGTGAMGAVYRARHLALDKIVAIKVLHDEHAGDAAFGARFQREAKAASRLNHPNSMAVIDFGQEPDGLLYIAMEYLDGRSLHQVLRADAPLVAARICDIVMQTLAALAVAHDSGIIHRDLKPENIMVLRGTNDDGQPTDVVKVCDFGIAKISDPRSYRSGEGMKDSAGPVTTTGFLVGTPEYMSPEQGRGEKLGAASDLYAVGVILYQLLAGVVPFEAENAIGVILRHITEVPRPPSSLNPSCDRRLEAICMRAMEKSPDARFASAREMRAAVRAARGLPSDLPSSSSIPVPSSGSLPVPSSGRDVGADGHAPTMAAAIAESELPKPTLHGTAASIPGLPRRGRLVALVSVISLVAATFLTVGIIRAFRTTSPSASPTYSRPTGDRSRSRAIQDDGELATPVEAMSDGPPSGEGSRVGHGKHGVAHGSTAALSGGLSPAAASAATPAAPSASSAATPSASVDPAPAAPPIAAPVEQVEPVAPPPDPTFDPSKGYVVIGMTNGMGVRSNGVKAALRQANLTGCYRAALRAHGERASGIATLSLSIDAQGVVRGAVLTGADFLPSMRACVQSAAYGVRVASAMVDSGGGTADVYLQFTEP